ncbi:hypothetical protein LMJ53_02380 [Rheinheimera sp. UJ51]|uniref:hypothetical protein n=1 Tax=Rheinheimera sp. UJ51 TaxID=2892446 RepID=UPI001E504232|nr:hypothetical protein [Rheinheimera sp. UJ51]MCC5450580.1 hypothetical protein [Rheinheimera sp. UJ51]
MRLSLVILLLTAFSISASENLSDHETFCQQDNTISCEHYLQQQLTATTPYSNNWFRIKAYQLNYLFDKNQFLQLQHEAEYLLTQPAMPDVFRVQLYFYYAKALFYFKKTDEAKIYAAKAVAILKEVYAAFGNPLRIVELANLHYYLGELDQAEQLLRFAQSHYSKSIDPLFLFELNSNLAHISHQRDDLTSAAAYRADALAAAISLGHTGKMIIGMGNLARTQQLLGQLAAADQLYQDSLKYTAEPEHQVQHHIHLLRLTEINLQLNRPTLARDYFQQIEPKLLSSFHMTLYQQFGTSLAQFTAQ